MHSPEVVRLGLWIPQQSQAVQAFRRLWAETSTCLQFGGSCSPWGRDHGSLLFSTSGTHTALAVTKWLSFASLGLQIAVAGSPASSIDTGFGVSTSGVAVHGSVLSHL